MLVYRVGAMAADDPSRRQLNVPMFDWLRVGSRSVHLRGRGSCPGKTLNSTLAHFTSYLGLLVPLTEGSFYYFYVLSVTNGIGRSLGGSSVGSPIN